MQVLCELSRSVGVACRDVTYALTEGATEMKSRKYWKRDLTVGMLLNVLVVLPLFCIMAARYPL